ncbi:hypothetical protein HII31_13072 [Pseudocercospora fuligena]|uniref:F-box domain-containing protein n=1 Tax=Pseudocercospora fuligena TaxID=685502 RepID=A0A8H6VBW9_9PEZI|nr:hypothetical protein HII31_13072 [Pseudocercospora fuligena]
MSAIKVFDTVELLESILLELPIRDVLLAQRIAKSWQQTITGSIKLQRSLFLKPVPAPPTSRSRTKRCMRFFDLDTPCATVLQTPGSKTLLTSVLPITKSSSTTVLHLDEPIASKMDCDTSSWRRMLLTQPSRGEDYFFSNATDELCLPTDDSMSFHPHGKVSHQGGAIIKHGTMFDLNAVRVEKQNGGVTLDDVAKGLEEVHEGWNAADFKGKKNGDFGWVGFRELETVVKFWEDITDVVEELL